MTTTRLTRGVAALSVASFLLLGACSSGGSDDDASSTTTADETTTTEASDETTTTEAEDDETTTTEAEDDGEGGEAAAGEKAAWAVDYETPGELLTTIEGENFTVDVYQVDVTDSPKDGNFVDPDTNEPILAEGDEIVFVNYVFTNTSDETIPLSFSLVDVTARYADWPWAQGMDTITDRDLWEEMGVLSTTITPDGTEAPFPWEPGTTFAAGDNFYYQPGGAITFTARLTPSDEEGDLISEERQEVEVETTIN